MTLATVAPGIAEALVATALGLFAAIPAVVVAYNRFARDIDRVAIKLETFIEEFSNILQRNCRHGPVGPTRLRQHRLGPLECSPPRLRLCRCTAPRGGAGRRRAACRRPDAASRRIAAGGRRTINEINMVPFIDVMLVLLIIFMVTAPLITPSLIDLPSVGKAARQPDQVIQVTVGKDEHLELKLADKSMSMPLKDIPPAILQAQQGKPAGSTAVVISADRNVKYESVVKVMIARAAEGRASSAWASVGAASSP